MAPTGSTGSTGNSSSSNGSTSNTNSPQGITETMFMQLLVAELQNQDPLDSPTDPTQFVTELAQFEQLEQSTNTSQDVASILQDLDQLVQQSGGTPSTGSTQS